MLVRFRLASAGHSDRRPMEKHGPPARILIEFPKQIGPPEARPAAKLARGDRGPKSN